jgi:hypothetical protein
MAFRFGDGRDIPPALLGGDIVGSDAPMRRFDDRGEQRERLDQPGQQGREHPVNFTGIKVDAGMLEAYKARVGDIGGSGEFSLCVVRQPS